MVKEPREKSHSAATDVAWMLNLLTAGVVDISTIQEAQNI